jgi:flagellar hook-associated protein 3 FlgL
MRIATSTIYDSQTSAIDNLAAQQQQYGNVLSSGKQLNAPSDDPSQIAQDLYLRTAIAQGNQTSTNVQNISSELTTVDGALSTLGNILQSARSIAVQAGSSTINTAQRQSLAEQVDNLLQEAIGVANTQYAGKYVFAGTAAPVGPPIVTSGQPISAVRFNGNLAQQKVQFAGGQSATAGVSLQQAFNFDAPDGSADVFQTLITLRDTLQNGTIDDSSSAAVNQSGTALSAASPLNSTNFKTALTPDSSGNISITIASGQQPNGIVLTFAPTSTIGSVVAAINASGAGVTASFDSKTQRISLTSAQPFQIKDAASPGASNTANLVEAFNLQPQADLVSSVSGQLGGIDNVIQAGVNARATVGAAIQSLNNQGTATDSQVVNDTKVQSGIEDADIAKVISQFSQTQTALQAAYGTTSRLEAKSLFDYLT